jgi:hypothetical protein
LTEPQIQSFLAYFITNATAFSQEWTFGTGTTKRAWYCQVDLHGGKNSAIAKVPKGATAYAHRDKLLLYQFADIVLAGTYPSTGFSFLKGFLGSITQGLREEEWGMYINYADTQLNQETAQRNYWRGNLGRLRQIKAAVDPDEVFYNTQSVRPARSCSN